MTNSNVQNLHQVAIDHLAEAVNSLTEMTATLSARITSLRDDFRAADQQSRDAIADLSRHLASHGERLVLLERRSAQRDREDEDDYHASLEEAEARELLGGES